MTVNLEKALILLVTTALIATSISLLITVEPTITRDQAIGISKKSHRVQQGLLMSSSFGIEANYYNSSRVEELKRLREQSIEELNRWRREQSPASGWLGNVTKDEFWEFKVPEGHSVWEIIWWFSNPGLPGGYNAIVAIDAERASIIAEPAGIMWE